MSNWTNFVHFVQGYFRRRRSQLYRLQCPDLAGKRVCDIGGSRHFWEMMPEDLVPSDLLLLNIADDGQSLSHTGRLANVEVRLYDGKHIPFPDGYFDVVMCNSVIEHVPVDQREQLCNEIRRVSKYYFVQTPAYAFPIEPHFVFPFIHWLPRSLGRKLVPFGIWAVFEKPSSKKMDDYFAEVNLLKKREVTNLLPNCKVQIERAFGLVKSYTAHGYGVLQ